MIQETGKVHFGRALKDYFKGYVEFLGRSTRAGYWWVQLVLVLISLALMIWLIFAVTVTFDDLTKAPNFGRLGLPILVFVIFVFGTLLPSLALRIRRFRDVGLRGRGAAVLLGIQTAVGATMSYEQYTRLFDNINQTNALLTPTTPSMSGSALFLVFITYAISLFLFVVTVLPSDVMTTSSSNEFWRFFLREKTNE